MEDARKAFEELLNTTLPSNQTISDAVNNVTDSQKALYAAQDEINANLTRLEDLAEDAKENCPISGVLNCEIILNASLV